jgi:uncharacterized protein DUF5681
MKTQNYSVGYRKPPRHTQFKKGQSGNPGGRDKGRANYRTEFLKELGERVTVTENGRLRKLSKQTLIIKRMVADAIKGDAKAREHMLRLIGQMEAFNADAMPATPTSAEDAEIMARFKARLAEEIKAQQEPAKDVTNG